MVLFKHGQLVSSFSNGVQRGGQEFNTCVYYYVWLLALSDRAFPYVQSSIKVLLKGVWKGLFNSNAGSLYCCWMQYNQQVCYARWWSSWRFLKLPSLSLFNWPSATIAGAAQHCTAPSCWIDPSFLGGEKLKVNEPGIFSRGNCRHH